MATLFGMRGGGGVTTSKWIVGVYPQGLQPAVSTIRPAKSAHDSMASLKLATSLNTATAASARPSNFPTVGVLQAKRVNFSGPAVFTPTRHLHSDVEFPNFDTYRSDACRDPTKPASETEDGRRMGLYGIVYGVGGMMTMVIGRDALLRVIDFKAMPADVRAMASIEVKLSEVPEGSTKTFEWRGKPVFIRHRTADEVASLREVDVASLRDPETDEVRVKRPDWSVVLGICTHLGCVPIADAGDFGGYFCPCHGSHYDGSGRVRKGPAPKNLEVPEYSFGADETVIVGKP